jgi:DNA transformation protein
MAITDDFLAYVVDQFSAWKPVTVHKMFGGAGLYGDGIMFGLIADDVFYLKVDDSNRKQFEQAGSGPFRPYPGKKTTMPYYVVPEEILESPARLGEWAAQSLAIAW